ncbi:MAG: hypothetical protein F4Z02_08085 [Acidimicrobiia bacterium]|nr:hypothetical protein [Acidimicrobiia bacterium]MYG72973.1 hypothetical protein [Acidimicrobiia bacterium]
MIDSAQMTDSMSRLEVVDLVVSLTTTLIVVTAALVALWRVARREWANRQMYKNDAEMQQRINDGLHGQFIPSSIDGDSWGYRSHEDSRDQPSYPVWIWMALKLFLSGRKREQQEPARPVQPE